MTARTFWLALALAATTTATTAATTGAAVKSPDAPADEYFGPFKYSAISIRTKINALGRSYNSRWADDGSLVHDAGMIESSYRVWAQRYPKDRWLAPTAFHLAQLYQEIQTQDAHDKALAMYRYVAQTFPKTKEGHFSRLRLAQGIPALHAESPVSPTPAPYGSPAPRPLRRLGRPGCIGRPGRVGRSGCHGCPGHARYVGRAARISRARCLGHAGCSARLCRFRRTGAERGTVSRAVARSYALIQAGR